MECPRCGDCFNGAIEVCPYCGAVPGKPPKPIPSARTEGHGLICDSVSGESLLFAFNHANENGLTLEQHIDIAIEMAMEEAARKQVEACALAIRDCERVQHNRIRVDEAVGACFSARLECKNSTSEAKP